MHLLLLPLDERPVNTQYPRAIAAIARATLDVPPPGALPSIRRAGDVAALHAWLLDRAPSADAVVVCLELAAFGGLIASRVGHESAATALARLDVLRAVHAAHPDVPIVAFGLVTRIPNDDHAFEEPDYWAQYGRAIFRWSQLSDRAALGHDVAAALAAQTATLPPGVLADVVARRLRNHTVNLGALGLLADGVFARLVISSDDTSAYGLGSAEKRALARWAALLPPDVAQRLLLLPGADELGCTLAAYALRGGAPFSAQVHYAIPADAGIIAPYEDGPVRDTVARQIAVVGGTVVATDADLIVAVNTPSPLRPDAFPYDHAEAERAARTAPVAAFADQIAAWVGAGRAVVVADVAYPNGADPVLVEALIARRLPARLAAYGAWNTAGNTLGTAIAQGVVTLGAHDAAAQRRFLAHRFVEDWGYQLVAREDVRTWLARESGVREITPGTHDAALARVTTALAQALAALPGFEGLRVAPGSVRFPWGRTFEVDFAITHAHG